MRNKHSDFVKFKDLTHLKKTVTSFRNIIATS